MEVALPIVKFDNLTHARAINPSSLISIRTRVFEKLKITNFDFSAQENKQIHLNKHFNGAATPSV